MLVAPYLPSARGDHDPTDDARVAAHLTAATGIKHIVTVDPHSPVWADEARRGGTAVTVIEAVDLVACGAAHHARAGRASSPPTRGPATVPDSGLPIGRAAVCRWEAT